jgi:hypothetical protein
MFEKNGSDISVIGTKIPLTPEHRGHEVTETTIELFGLKNDINFNGGFYYFKKSPKADACINYILNDLLPHYNEYGLGLADGKMHDEPLFYMGMLLYGMEPLNDHKKIMRPLYKTSGEQKLKWDQKNKKCTYFDYSNDVVSPSILHWMTNNTHSIKYVKYNSIVKSKFYKKNRLRTGFSLWIDANRFLVKDKLYHWLKAHFCVSYFKFTIHRIKALFKKSKT